MQFDFVRFLFKKKFRRRKFHFFSFETFCLEYIFVSLQNIFNKIQLEEILALIIFFLQLSVNLRKLTVSPYDFFCCGRKIVSFHPAKGRPVHAVSITLSNWYSWPFFYCCRFLVFSASNIRLSGIRDS